MASLLSTGPIPHSTAADALPRSGAHPDLAGEGGRVVSLIRGTPQFIALRAGDSLSCEAGVVWATDSQGTDILLAAGQTWRSARADTLLIEALEPVRLRVTDRRFSPA